MLKAIDTDQSGGVDECSADYVKASGPSPHCLPAMLTPITMPVMRNSYTGTPVTLADLIRDGRLLWLYCLACRHEVEVDPASLPVPADTPVPAIRQRLKCSKCGSRDIEAKPQLHPTPLAVIRALAQGR